MLCVMLAMRMAAACRGYYAVSGGEVLYQSCTGGDALVVRTAYDRMRPYSYDLAHDCRFNAPDASMLVMALSTRSFMDAQSVALCAETDTDFVCPSRNGTRLVAWMRSVRMARREGLDRAQMLRRCLRVNVTLSTPKIYEGFKPHEDLVFAALLVGLISMFVCALCCRRHNYRRL
jgi:hypothetical protein